MKKVCKIFPRTFIFGTLCCWTLCNAMAAQEPIQLCPRGYYVAKCGDYTIGTNLLKGYMIGTDQSPDYYDYANQRNLDNLRKFFAGEEAFRYRTKTTHTVIEVSPTGSDGYLQHRDALLSTICNTTDITCTKCPEGGTVDASVMYLDTDNNSPVDWEFHSKSDCYMKEFSDSTGVFEYVASESATQSQNCYYSIETTGSTLVIPTIINSSTSAETGPETPID